MRKYVHLWFYKKTDTILLYNVVQGQWMSLVGSGGEGRGRGEGSPPPTSPPQASSILNQASHPSRPGPGPGCWRSLGQFNRQYNRQFNRQYNRQFNRQFNMQFNAILWCWPFPWCFALKQMNSKNWWLQNDRKDHTINFAPRSINNLPTTLRLFERVLWSGKNVMLLS